MARGRVVPEGFLRRALAACLLLGLAAGGAACDLFEARKPNDPGSNFFPCLSLGDKENVFTNILRSYGRGDGLSCYLTTLDETGFAFHPDPADSTEAPADLYKNWTKLVERQVTQNLVSGATSFGLRYTDTLVVSPGDDAEVRRYTYEIEFKGAAIPDTLFQGIAEITIRRSNAGLWQVTDWVDRRDPGGTTTRTWGFLRGAFRSGI
ncbi:MAG TPA: hypothetical protein VLT84_11100 [Acidobacteriota bacterium]|nr:hypothetical protein [Acidobacteriota bacterium]